MLQAAPGPPSDEPELGACLRLNKGTITLSHSRRKLSWPPPTARAPRPLPQATHPRHNCCRYHAPSRPSTSMRSFQACLSFNRFQSALYYLMSPLPSPRGLFPTRFLRERASPPAPRLRLISQLPGESSGRVGERWESRGEVRTARSTRSLSLDNPSNSGERAPGVTGRSLSLSNQHR
mgnify:CR=1 FL=1